MLPKIVIFSVRRFRLGCRGRHFGFSSTGQVGFDIAIAIEGLTFDVWSDSEVMAAQSGRGGSVPVGSVDVEEDYRRSHPSPSATEERHRAAEPSDGSFRETAAPESLGFQLLGCFV